MGDSHSIHGVGITVTWHLSFICQSILGTNNSEYLVCQRNLYNNLTLLCCKYNPFNGANSMQYNAYLILYFEHCFILLIL